MRRRMSKVQFAVSPSAIKNEIRKAAKRLHAMERKASPKKLKAVKSELKILRKFCIALGNIECI